MALSPNTAREILHRCRVPQDNPDYHALTSAIVDSLTAEMRESGYRAPRNRNGSATRYFYAFLVRRAERKES